MAESSRTTISKRPLKTLLLKAEQTLGRTRTGKDQEVLDAELLHLSL